MAPPAAAAAAGAISFLSHADRVRALLQENFINGLDSDPFQNFNITDSSDEEALWHT